MLPQGLNANLDFPVPQEQAAGLSRLPRNIVLDFHYHSPRPSHFSHGVCVLFQLILAISLRFGMPLARESCSLFSRNREKGFSAFPFAGCGASESDRGPCLWHGSHKGLLNSCTHTTLGSPMATGNNNAAGSAFYAPQPQLSRRTRHSGRTFRSHTTPVRRSGLPIQIRVSCLQCKRSPFCCNVTELYGLPRGRRQKRVRRTDANQSARTK